MEKCACGYAGCFSHKWCHKLDWTTRRGRVWVLASLPSFLWSPWSWLRVESLNESSSLFAIWRKTEDEYLNRKILVLKHGSPPLGVLAQTSNINLSMNLIRVLLMLTPLLPPFPTYSPILFPLAAPLITCDQCKHLPLFYEYTYICIMRWVHHVVHTQIKTKQNIDVNKERWCAITFRFTTSIFISLYIWFLLRPIMV